MAIYVMSDIHGEYEKYRKMLEKIMFSDEDQLFVLGDMVDRGPEPVKLLLDMSQRSNVFPIMGNHDFMAYNILSKLTVEITEDNAEDHVTLPVMNELIDWLYEGGGSTMKGFQQLPAEDREMLISYISSFPFYDIAETENDLFVLVHAGLQNFRPDKKLSEYTPEELLNGRTDTDKRYFPDDDVYLVTGHTPTPFYHGKPTIYRSLNNICIDCGACSPDGKLGCLCLDTMEEFYV